jgi:hypothetical protein
MRHSLATNNTRPKVDLKLGEPVRLKLLRDAPYEGENSYGPYYLYTVEENGNEKAFFATQDIHMKIREHKLKQGDEFILEKKTTQKGKRVVTEISFEAMPAERTNGDCRINGDGLKQIMLECLRDAVEVTRAVDGVPFETMDIQQLATTLFIQRSTHTSNLHMYIEL